MNVLPHTATKEFQEGYLANVQTIVRVDLAILSIRIETFRSMFMGNRPPNTAERIDAVRIIANKFEHHISHVSNHLFPALLADNPDEKRTQIIAEIGQEQVTLLEQAQEWQILLLNRNLADCTEALWTAMLDFITDVEKYIVKEGQLFPAISEESKEMLVSDTVSPTIPDGPKIVVVAEDESGARKFMAEVLREMGCIVLEAENGAEAFRIFEDADERKIDLLLTDIVMPVMGGKELAYKVRSMSPETKIIYASAYPEKLGVRNGMFDQNIPFLQKPVTITALQLKMREILGLAQDVLKQDSPVTRAELTPS